jgi:hypothetical protein
LLSLCCSLSPPQGSLDNINLFQVITVMSFFFLLPVTLLVERAPLLNLAAPVRAAQAPLLRLFAATALRVLTWTQGLSSSAQELMLQRLLCAGLCFHCE